jgi:hypothetical protein
LGVLIPLAGEVVKQGAGITAIRLASLAAVCIALLYARLICSDLGMRAFPTAFVLAYLAFDQNMIFYGMSGMETQVAVAIVLGGVHHVRRNDLITSGIFLGLAPLVRPEFVLWVAPAFFYLGLRNRARVAKTVTVAAAVVIPWIVFTFLYYGSPIPNTIIAKATIGRIPPILSGGSLLPWTEWLAVKVVGHTELLLRYVEPFYENWSTVAAPIPSPYLAAVAVIVTDLVVIGLLASRRISKFWPVLVFLALFVAYRIYFLPIDHYSDWYMPPFLALLMIVAGLGLQQVAFRAPKLSTTLAVAICSRAVSGAHPRPVRWRPRPARPRARPHPLQSYSGRGGRANRARRPGARVLRLGPLRGQRRVHRDLERRRRWRGCPRGHIRRNSLIPKGPGRPGAELSGPLLTSSHRSPAGRLLRLVERSESWYRSDNRTP